MLVSCTILLPDRGRLLKLTLFQSSHLVFHSIPLVSQFLNQAFLLKCYEIVSLSLRIQLRPRNANAWTGPLVEVNTIPVVSPCYPTPSLSFSASISGCSDGIGKVSMRKRTWDNKGEMSFRFLQNLDADAVMLLGLLLKLTLLQLSHLIFYELPLRF